MNEGINNLINKGRKVWFSIQRTLHKSRRKTIKTYLCLIDSLVKPIILYACEAWGDMATKNPFNQKIEKFHLSMCKQLLGLKKRANYVNTFAELGRFALYTNIESQIFKYFERFVHIDKESILYKVFQEELLNNIANTSCWLSYLRIDKKIKKAYLNKEYRTHTFRYIFVMKKVYIIFLDKRMSIMLKDISIFISTSIDKLYPV